MFSVRWNKPEDKLEFKINNKKSEIHNGFNEFFPTKFNSDVFIGTFATQESVHYLQSCLFRVQFSDEYFDDEMIEIEYDSFNNDLNEK